MSLLSTADLGCSSCGSGLLLGAGSLRRFTHTGPGRHTGRADPPVTQGGRGTALATSPWASSVLPQEWPNPNLALSAPHPSIFRVFRVSLLPWCGNPGPPEAASLPAPSPTFLGLAQSQMT